MAVNHRLKSTMLSVSLLIGLVGCTSTPKMGLSAQAGNETGCITAFNAETDYFPTKSSFESATGVKVEYHKSYKVVTVSKQTEDASPESYVLVQCGAPKPELTGKLAQAQVIQIPVKKVAAASTTQLPAFDMLDRVDTLVGVQSPELVSNEKVRKAIDSGKVKGFGTPAGDLSIEQVAALSPDLYMSGGLPDPTHEKIRELGIPVVDNAEWLEPTPLGRAEWLKFTALFLNGEQQANAQFKPIAERYNKAKGAAQATKERPSVVAGAPFKGTWYVAGGEGYLATFLTDAGASYVFSDRPGTESLPTDIEVVLAKAGDAQIWINPTQTANSVTDLVTEDPRFANIRAVRDGQVWNPTLKTTPSGGNDFWELGVARPDLVLEDLIEAFHPGTLTDHTFTFYKKLGK